MAERADKKISTFQREVFRVVSRIPLGETRSYKWVAQSLGKKEKARAVGRALANNPFPLLIPCHRVICSNGKIGGYVLGRKVKQELLRIEKGIVEGSFKGKGIAKYKEIWYKIRLSIQ